MADEITLSEALEHIATAHPNLPTREALASGKILISERTTRSQLAAKAAELSRAFPERDPQGRFASPPPAKNILEMTEAEVAQMTPQEIMNAMPSMRRGTGAANIYKRIAAQSKKGKQ